MATSLDVMADLYRRRARFYDYSANFYYLIGFREYAYRRQAVAALGLKPGDTVVEIGCGTGLNFSLLQASVGATGRVIGVDLTDAMLEQARQRVAAHGWRNVELVQSDAAEYTFPAKVDGILSTFAISLSPEYDRIIQRGAAALVAGKRYVILDLKKPDGVPSWLVKLGVTITRPFGVTEDQIHRHPWASMDKYLANMSVKDLYFGFAYLAVGEGLPELHGNN